MVGGLQTLNAQLRERYARAVSGTPASAWGSIGDDEHDADSDHYPHFYAALGPMAVVCARDFPHAPALGLHFGTVAESLRLSRDPRIGYVIFAGRVFSGHTVGGVPAYVWRPYSGKDGHYTHGHVSSVHTAAADDSRPWALPGGTMTGTDMSWNDIQKADAVFNNTETATLDTDGTADGKGNLKAFPNLTYAAIQALTDRVAALEAQAGNGGTVPGGGVSEDRAREIAREELDNADLRPGD